VLACLCGLVAAEDKAVGYAKIFKWIKDDGTTEYGSEEFENHKEERAFLKEKQLSILADYNDKLKASKSKDNKGDVTKPVKKPSYRLESNKYKLDKAGLAKLNKALDEQEKKASK
jgi:hypothetical protein